jgi:hypothetical protein
MIFPTSKVRFSPPRASSFPPEQIAEVFNNFAQVGSPLVQAATRGSDTPPFSSWRDTAPRSSGSRLISLLLLVQTNPMLMLIYSMASRTSFAADAAIAPLKAAIPAAQVEFLVFDLASLRVAKATADEFLERDAPGYTGFERGGGRCFLPLCRCCT